MKVAGVKEPQHGWQSVSDKDLARLEESFRTIADSIADARKVMAEITEREAYWTSLSRVVREHDMLRNSQLTLDEDALAVENALAALFKGVDPVELNDHLRERLTGYFNIEGWGAAGVLACLLRYPGQYISHVNLARSAGVQSTSSGVIRVYICQLRSTLEGNGLSGETIETGRRSYRIVRSAAFEIINALARVQLGGTKE